MNMKKKILFLFGIIFIFSVVSEECFAEPSINSVSTNGNSITISGSSFGEKSQAAPLRFETFEQGKNAQTLRSDAYWTTYASGNPTFSSTNQRSSNSALNAKFRITNADEFYKIIPELSKDNSKLFLSFWLYIDIQGSGWLDDGSNPQLKVMRLTNNGSYSDPPKMLWQSFTDDQTLYAFSQSYVSADDSTGGALGGGLGRGTAYNGGMIRPRKGQWLNVQIQYQNAVSPKTTTIKWRQSYGNSSYQGINYNNVSPIRKSGGPYLNTIKLGFHAEHADGGYNYWDDIYIDNSWARVEIGDASTYDKCTHREMQMPTSWSSNNISITTYTGSFSSGDTIYLFVVDSEGNPSSGYKLTVGSEETIQAPKNLRVVDN